MRSDQVVSSLRSFLVAALLASLPVIVSGQAWTPPAGSGSLWLSTQTLHADGHTDGQQQLAHNIDLRAYSLTASVDYGVTDRLALSASIPYISSRYRGRGAHAGSIVDDGNYHGSLSDFAVEVRYRLVDSDLIVTPFVSGLWPSRNYPTLGHASAGRGLVEYSGGFEFGHDASWLLPELFVGATYQYSMVQKVHDDISVDRSNAQLRFAYFLTPRIAVHAANSWQQTHGGINLPLSREETFRHAQHHDQMLNADHWRTSAGLSYSLTETLELSASWATSIKSRNSHAFRTLTLGAGWSFNSPIPWPLGGRKREQDSPRSTRP